MSIESAHTYIKDEQSVHVKPFQDLSMTLLQIPCVSSMKKTNIEGHIIHVITHVWFINSTYFALFPPLLLFTASPVY